MTETTRDKGEKPSEPPEPGPQVRDPKSGTPGAENVDRQDKTKDKPDSGQNEDG